jgi:hypothetical protein
MQGLKACAERCYERIYPIVQIGSGAQLYEYFDPAQRSIPHAPGQRLDPDRSEELLAGCYIHSKLEPFLII